MTKAITLTQPWASLVIAGAKHWETRGWYPRSLQFGERLLIHAAKGWTADDREFAARLYARGVIATVPSHLPLGAMLGSVRLVSLVRTTLAVSRGYVDELEQELGDYSPGRYAWEFDSIEVLAQPIPARGALGLWDFDPGTVLGRTVEQIGAGL